MNIAELHRLEAEATLEKASLRLRQSGLYTDADLANHLDTMRNALPELLKALEAYQQLYGPKPVVSGSISSALPPTKASMSVEAPERIWVERDPDTGEKRWFSIKGMGDTEYVRADKLEELELHVRHADAYLQSAQGAIQRAEAAEAALAEAKRENEALREDRDFLQEILDMRPAINADLPESYIRWSQSLYSGEAVRAWLSARNAGGNDAQ